MEKNEKAVILALAASLAGCANNAVRPETEALAREPVICETKAQCDFYWQRAQVFIATYSRYRIQTATDTVLETYGPLGSNVELAYKVIRISNTNGSAQITINAGCANMFGCSPDRFVGIANFKNYLRLSD